MRIRCPNCGTVYNFDEDRIRGRRVKMRCSRCGHIFPFDLSSASHVEEALDGEERNWEETERLLSYKAGEKGWGGYDDGERGGRTPAADEPGQDLGIDMRDLLGEEAVYAKERRKSVAEFEAERWGIKAKRNAIRILISVAAVFVIAFVSAKFVDFRIPGLSSSVNNWFHGSASDKDMLAMMGAEGEYLWNDKVGLIYVVRGVVKNEGSDARKAVKIRCALYDSSGTVLMEESTYCGLSVSHRELVNLSGGEIRRLLSSEPDILRGIIGPGRIGTFMAVFLDVPINAVEFSASIEGSEGM